MTASEPEKQAGKTGETLPVHETPRGNVLVIAEQIMGELQPVSLELIGAASILAGKLGTKVLCLIMGYKLGDIPQRLVAHGADTVYVADHPELALYRTLPYRRVVTDLLESMPEPPHVALLGSTTTGRDLAPRIAAHFETGLTADCTELDIGPYEHKSKIDPTKLGLYPDCLYAIRPSFGESLKARILGPWKNPQMATTRPGVMVPLPADPARQGKIIEVPVNLKLEDFRLQVIDVVREVASGLKLTEAEVIIAGGYGMGNAEGFNLLRQLAGCFDHSAIAASRKVVDLGWIPYEHQVGQTGKTVRPKLYIACGISGAIQHRVGMSKSATIIAINKDPDAPVFKFAHHGIVGDVYQVIPELIKQFEKAKQGVESVVHSH
ncbi:MAG: electron transfer flavoprotein subunit alpha/FixB family protein [Candidatus Obscuribacterales bacterium]|jgi:electron transfer flavoprotein alpha subunit|nr:electron transfer flavoprotein subunit alpha/FixB family protein [Candidatus Obscuribacterales bacterium]